MEWINVKDKLPEISRNTLPVWEKEYNCLALAIFTGDTKVGQWEVHPVRGVWYTTNSLITHWMPLPEPPQEKAEPEFDEYEVYYFDELIAEVKDYRKGFDSIIYGLSTDTQIVKC
jgi:hypothetical protein